MKALICLGTRPEAIKLAPIYHEALKRNIDVKICTTGQHKELLSPFMNFFELPSDYKLEVMKKGQSLASLTSTILSKMDTVLDDFQPDIVLTQGDTTTTFSASLASFFNKTPIAHIEAGLRSFNLHSPFPEEANRKMVSTIASFHFCPTNIAAENLKNEGVIDNVHVTGNTSIDSLKITLKKIEDDKYLSQFPSVDFSKRIILVTTHRRENYGKALETICKHLIKIKQEFNDVEIVLPVHLNPKVVETVHRVLGGHNGIHLIEPLEYVSFVWLMSKSHIILTDSGGVQEEAPSLKKPVLVLRDTTERSEGLQAGTLKLVPPLTSDISQEVKKLLSNRELYKSYQDNKNPFGDGEAAPRVWDIICKDHL